MQIEKFTNQLYILSIISGMLMIWGSGFYVGATFHKRNKTELKYTVWTDEAYSKTSITIKGQKYYGDSVEKIAGENRYMVIRDNNYLVLPDGIIVEEVVK
jgi:hypothetical protein